MKKRKLLISVLLVVVLFSLGIIGGKMYMDTEHQKQEVEKLKETIKKEKIASQQIKNTFSNIQEIHFLEDYSKNEMTGFITSNVVVKTSRMEKSEFDVDMTNSDNPKEQYSGTGEQPELEKGKTAEKVKVIYSDNSEGEV